MADTSCSDGVCTEARRGQGMLQTKVNSLKQDEMDDIPDAALVEHGAKRGKSCLDPDMPDEPFPEDGHKGNPYGGWMVCREGITWEKSEFIQDLFDKYGQDGDTYLFMMCYEHSFDPEKRWFPWFYTNTGDFKKELVYVGSTIISPIDLLGIWMDGFQQVVPEALDWFARMGEIEERKIIPKFMMYGWSKGATGSWQIGKKRSDIVQGSALLHGCVSSKQFDDTYTKKAEKKGTPPHLIISSPLDLYVKCTWSDSQKHFKKLKGYQGVTFAESPCGHHPDQCYPACDLNKTFYDPFWAFVKTAYEDSSLCNQWKSPEDCSAMLCLWDTTLDVCTDAHPVKMTPTCATFCESELVEFCGPLSEEECSGHHMILSVDEASAKGMHSRCEWTGTECWHAEASFQCFFQDQC